MFFFVCGDFTEHSACARIVLIWAHSNKNIFAQANLDHQLHNSIT